MDIDQREKVKGTVARIREYDAYRRRWLDDPTRNLCSSIAIERMALQAVRQDSHTWYVQLQRYNAALEALQRIMRQRPLASSQWTMALLELEDVDNSPRPTAWDYAVTLAVMLGLEEVPW